MRRSPPSTIPISSDRLNSPPIMPAKRKQKQEGKSFHWRKTINACRSHKGIPVLRATSAGIVNYGSGEDKSSSMMLSLPISVPKPGQTNAINAPYRKPEVEFVDMPFSRE